MQLVQLRKESVKDLNYICEEEEERHAEDEGSNPIVAGYFEITISFSSFVLIFSQRNNNKTNARCEINEALI